MIELDFYTLRPDVVKSIAKHGLSKAESKLFFYLLQLDPFGDRPIKVKVAEILLATGIGKTAYHQAIVKFEQLGWFDFRHTDVHISNLSCVRKSEKTNQKSVKTEKRFGKTDSRFGKTESRDLETAQGEDSISPHTDLKLIHTDPDQDEEIFEDFENAKLSEFEQAIYSCTDEAIEKCNSEASEQVEDKNTPEQAINPDGGDPFRRKLEDFILKSLQVSPRDRSAYFSRFTQADWEKWEAKMKPPASPPIPHRDPVAEDPYRVENAIASMVKCQDFEAVESRLASLSDRNLAHRLREKYLCN